MDLDPVEVREQRVTTTPGVAPAGQVAPDGAVAPVGTAPVAPVAPAAPVASTGVSSTRVATSSGGSRLSQFVWLIAGVVDIILALDFIFWAASANGSSGFVHYIYRLGGWLAAPFNGIFSTTVAANGTSVLRWSDVLAVAIYSIAAWIVTRLVAILAPRPRVNPV